MQHLNRSPSTPEMEALRQMIADPSNFVFIEKYKIRELIDLWSAVLEFQGVLEMSQVLRGKEKLTREWAYVAHYIKRLG